MLLDKDEHPRAGTTIEALAKLEPAFVDDGRATPSGRTARRSTSSRSQALPATARQIDHVHTAGNSSGIVDGAAVVLLASGDYAKAHGLKPRARIRAMATAGRRAGHHAHRARAGVARRRSSKAGMSAKDIDLWEINEAFAAVPLQTARKLGIDPARVNVNGGAIALGHPLGATGACSSARRSTSSSAPDKATALITLCIGGGMGIATIIERV